MPPEVRGQGVAFDDAIDFLRNKVALPSKHWTDYRRVEHARGFVVAGAVKDELVTDFHQAVTRMAAEGRTITDFRQDFDRIVAEHGWSYNGSRG